MISQFAEAQGDPNQPPQNNGNSRRQNIYRRSSVPTETVTDNLTPEEQDSLAVGEKLQAEQETLLAGKYKSTEDLEKAYKELESKLGSQQEEDTESTQVEEETAEDKPSLSDNASLNN